MKIVVPKRREGRRGDVKHALTKYGAVPKAQTVTERDGKIRNLLVATVSRP